MDIEKFETLKAAAPKILEQIQWLKLGNGWLDLLLELVKDLETLADEYDDVYATEITEHHGALRFYLNEEPTEEFSERIERAEAASRATCANCGVDGRKQRVEGRLSVLCGDCSSVDRSLGSVS